MTDLRQLETAAGRIAVTEDAGVVPDGGMVILRPDAWSADLDVVAHHVRSIPAVTVLVADVSAVPAASRELVEAVDVCIGTGRGPLDRPWLSAGLDELVAAVEAQPLASYALVALTRVSSRMEGGDAIWAESATYSTLLGSRPHMAWRAERSVKAWQPQDDPPLLQDEVLGVLRLRLNRPQVRNAIDVGMRDALVAALELAEVRSDLRIELSGAGVCFCSGGDLSEFGKVEDPATAHAIRAVRHPALAMWRVADRIKVEAHGANVGAGVELLAFASRVVAERGSTFRLPEVSMGLVPGAGGTWSLARRIGRQRANWMMLTGAEVDADTALAWGLADMLTSS